MKQGKIKKIIFSITFFAVSALLLASCTASPEEAVSTSENESLAAAITTVTNATTATTAAETEPVTTTVAEPPYVEPPVEIIECNAYNEMIQLSFKVAEGADYEVFYKKAAESDYLNVASELITVNEAGDHVCTILGISSGDYEVLVKSRNSEGEFENKLENIGVAGLDRSGYAHFGNAEGIGAYNDDGTLKDNMERTTFTFEVEQGKTYYIAASSGFVYFSIY